MFDRTNTASTTATTPYDKVYGGDVYLQPYIDALNDIDTTKKNASSSSGSTIRAIVMKVIGDGYIFNGYDEIKDCIINHHSNVDDKLVSTLDLFSYGTYTDYNNDCTNNGGTKYLQLNDAQIRKLKQLTIIQVIQDACSVSTKKKQEQQGQQQQNYCSIPYIELGTSVQLSNVREIEQLVATIIGLNVINGKLSQRYQSLIITQILTTRDVPVQNVTSILLPTIQQLQQKVIQSSKLIDTYQRTITNELIQQYKLDYHKQQTQENKTASILLQQQQVQVQQQQQQHYQSNSGFGGGGGGSMYAVDPMDVDYGGTSNQFTSSAAAARRQKRSLGGIYNNMF